MTREAERTVIPGKPKQDAPELTLDGVGKVFEGQDGPDITALERIDMRVGPGRMTSIIGPSGCGKSTLLSILAGLDRPTSGTVRIGDTVLRGPYPGVAMVFQRDLLLPWRTALTNVLLPLELMGSSAKRSVDRARDLLSLVGLDGFDRHYPDQLSGGMRQRVAIARALIQDPQVLLMDEPFGALDALTREQLNLELETSIRQSGATAVLVTHSIEEAIFMADNVAVISPRPGRVTATLDIDLPRPRTLMTKRGDTFQGYLDTVRRVFESEGVLKG